MAAQTDRGVPLSTLCPKYLHTNSTSHTWPFSAIAELIDNAYDPDVCAKQFWIDKTMVKDQDCLSFMDNGNGLDHEAMHKMLSFGYSDKVAVKGHKPIGMYGNGFKSGAMRLGRDAIVFSKSKNASCVGMLSQTYLEEIGAEQIVVPIICFEQTDTNKFSVREAHKASLQDILRYSPFKTQDELLVELDAISSTCFPKKTGTRIIIWNLRRTSSGTTEFDFEEQRYDIRIQNDVYEAMNDTSQHPGGTSHIPECVYSLRAYCTILYLKPQMQINIRGQKVKSQLIAKSLAYVEKDHYSPTFLEPSHQNKRIPITFGYNTKSKDQYGIMMYHKNRLIKAYERVGCQLKANNKGVGVIGVIDCFFLEPTHNKQSFNETDKYRKTMNSLGTKLEEYWQEIRHKRNKEDPTNTTPVEDTIKRPDQNWVQCDNCLHWRKLPDGIDCSKLPDKWFCHMNPDPQFRSCTVDQEPVDSEDDKPSYRKTYKQQEREDKRNEEKKRRKDEEDQKRKEEQRLAAIAKQEQALKRKHENLERQLNQTTPLKSTTPRSRVKTYSVQGSAARAKSSSQNASTISEAACSPSSSSGLPIISNVCSLSTGPKRQLILQPDTSETPKRPRVNGFHQGTPDTSPSVNMNPLSIPSVHDDDDADDTDDDIFILETASTPKPKKPGFDLTKVKTEREQSGDDDDDNIGMLLECGDDAAVTDVTSGTNVAETGYAGSADVGTSPAPARPPEVTSCTTQTEVPKVKKEEEEDQNPLEGEERAGQSSHVDINVSVEQRAFKEESSGYAHSDDQGKQTLQNGANHHLDSEEDAGPSCRSSQLHHPSMIEVQEQQDIKDYKGLFEKAKQKVDELIKEKEAADQDDEIALQVDRLLRELDQRNKERDEMRSQLESLERERANLASSCETLRSSLQQQRENAQEGSTTPHSATDSSVQTDPDVARGTVDSDACSSSDTFRSTLIELRHNVGRLLVSFVPALDLGQVNYECNVIDEILEQVLSDVESVI